MKIKITKADAVRWVKEQDLKAYTDADWKSDAVKGLDDVADVKPTVKAKPTVKKAEAQVIEQGEE
jgi:hypothetical protein